MIISKKQHSHSAMFTGMLASTPVLFLALILPLNLLLSSCDNSSDGNIHNQRGKQPLHRVEVVTVEIKPVNLEQTISGTLEAVTKIRLYNEESARITELPYHEGDFVKKGTLLVQLDNELLKTDLAKAKATREQEKVDLDRLKKLLPKKISTEEEVAKARTELDLAIAEEKRQLTRLKRTSIKAPIDGLITKRFYEPGDMLPAQSQILTIIDPSKLQLKASIAERWLPLVDKGQQVKLRIDALGDREYDAKIIRIHPTIDASTHKGIIEILLEPVPDSAKVGQFVRATIELKSSERLIIPVHTIHFDPEGAYVFRIIENDSGDTVAEKVFFEQGQQFGTVTEILSDLKPGDKVVNRGFLSLRDGRKVKITNSENSANIDDNTATSSGTDGH